MAQRTVHYLFGEIISNQVKLTNKERFLLGSVLPDAADAVDRDRAHFKVKTDTLVYYDFEAFRNQYADLLRQDDLYLGYYMHLIEDAFYRAFIYRDGITMPRSKEEVRLLHNDYHILNAYIVKKYGIRNILQGNPVSEDDPISSIASFNINAFLHDMAADFTEQTDGTPVFLTKEMLDEFIELYTPLAVKEIESIKNGTTLLRAVDYAWQRKQ